MGILYKWYNEEKTIIHLYFEQKWEWHDLYNMDRETDFMLEQVSHPVCYLIDMRDTDGIPRGISLSKMRQVIGETHPQSDLMVVVGMKPFIRMMVNTVVRALGTVSARLHSVATIEEAEIELNRRLVELGLASKIDETS